MTDQAKKLFLEDCAAMWENAEGRVIVVGVAGDDNNYRFDCIGTVTPEVMQEAFRIMGNDEPDLIEPLDLKGAVH